MHNDRATRGPYTFDANESGGEQQIERHRNSQLGRNSLRIHEGGIFIRLRDEIPRSDSHRCVQSGFPGKKHFFSRLLADESELSGAETDEAEVDGLIELGDNCDRVGDSRGLLFHIFG